MPDMTTTEAAQYLAERGYTVHSKKTGADSPPAAELVKRWCIQGKLKGRKRENRWLISKRELDRFMAVNVATNVAEKTDTASECGATPHSFPV